MTWTFNELEFRAWVDGREATFAGGPSSQRPTVRGILYLALLDRVGEWTTYSDIHHIIESRRVVRSVQAGTTAPLPDSTLRVALQELADGLARAKHKYHVEFRPVAERRERKVAEFRLCASSQIADSASTLTHLTIDKASSGEVIDHVCEEILDGVLPPRSLYYFPRAAATWIANCSAEGDEKQQYEGESWSSLSSREAFLSSARAASKLSIIGLGVGEGLGEISLLDRVLHDHEIDAAVTIDYLAIDFSPVLLLSHYQRLHERFSADIRAGRLRVLALNEEIENPPAVLESARKLAGGSFADRTAPVLVTAFGNVLGNGGIGREEYILGRWKAALSGFIQQRVFLVGIAKAPDLGQPLSSTPFDYSWFYPFLLSTPYHLIHKVGALTTDVDEFRQSADLVGGEFDASCARSRVEVRVQPVTTPLGLSALTYQFFYTLAHQLEFPRQLRKLAAGERILLYTINKYDINSFVQRATRLGFRAQLSQTQFFVGQPAQDGSDPKPEHLRAYQILELVLESNP